jgi:CBS domain-containing protein
MQASDVMTSPVFVVAPHENVAHARNLMLKHKISRLPVMDNGCLAGIITKKDIGYRLRQSEPVWRRRPIDNIPVSVLMTSNYGRTGYQWRTCD